MIRYTKKIEVIITVFMALIWTALFWGTDYYETTFLFIGMISVLCTYLEEGKIELRGKQGYVLLSCLMSFSLMIVDYSLFIGGGLCGLIRGGIAWGIGTFLIANIFVRLEILITKLKLTGEVKRRKSIIACAFFVPTIIDFAYLYLCAYPGWISNDIVSQISQMYNGYYSNHHPFWHTKLLEAVIMPVYRLTGNGNTATSVYCVIQIIIMSIAFSFFIDTLLAKKIKENIVIAGIALYGLLPYNVGMSCALTKDVAFAIAVSFFVTSSYRILCNIGRSWINYLVAFIGACGACLLRTNGKIAFAILLLTVWICMDKKKQKEFLAICTVAFVVSVLLNSFYLKYRKIDPPDTVESLSIPLQQLARCSADKKELNPEELMFINSFGDYEKFSEVYYCYGSDNIKNYIRREGNQEFLEQNKLQFIKIWIKVGVKYPFNYIKAWIDETSGYWSGSHYYSIWHRGIDDGIDLSWFNMKNTEHNSTAVKIWEIWESVITHNDIPFSEVILAVGLRFWILCFVGVWSIRHKKKTGVLVVYPISLVLTLAIATPLAIEFRYAYALFACFCLCAIGPIIDE